MTEKLERLKLKRRGQRGTVMKNRQEATSLLEADTIEPSLLRCLKTIQGLLEEKRAILRALDEEIIESCELTDVEQETVDSEEVSELIVECIDRIKGIITERTEVIQETTLTAHESEYVLARASEDMLSHDKTVRVNSDKTKSGVPAVRHARSGSPTTVDKSLERNESLVTMKPKLPRIELPKFTGDVMKFCSFWESFESSVDHNPNLSTIDKFNYFKALLEGSAARSVQGLALTEANYTAATDILKE